MGCEVRYAREMVYADGIDLDNLDAAVPVGVTCRLCERMDCQQRAFPPFNTACRSTRICGGCLSTRRWWKKATEVDTAPAARSD